jgi:hypothetical protein
VHSTEEELRMKTKLVILLAVLTVAVVLAFAATPAVPNAALKVTVPAAGNQATLPLTNVAEPHPEIRDALRALRTAKAHMEHAAHDFGGHRVDAIRATDEAIRQLEICLKYDRH